MECVAYMRVSTEKQAEEGNGLDSQRRDIENYCRKNELVITDWYIDDGYTGANMDRPELQRLVSDCDRKRVGYVVAFKLDRISRSMVDGIYLIERVFLKNNVEFKCVHDSISYDNPMEQAYTQMMAVFAQLDKNTMLLRMRGGMLERVKQGYWMGGGNLPYCYTYSKDTGTLIPIPERKEQANKAMDLFLQGYSDVKIRDMLGFKSEFIVKQVLTSPVNIGMIPYKGNIYQGLHEPIFNKEVFEKAQQFRAIRKNKRASCHNIQTNLLTGLCYCGICGCAMRYQKWTHGKHKIYCCSRNKDLHYLPNHNPNCNNTLEWASDIEKAVEDEILLISANISDYKPRVKESKLEILQGQLEKEQTKRKRLYNLYAEGNDDVIGMIKEIEKVIEDIRKQIKEESAIETNKTRQNVFKNIKNLADIWEDIDKKQKNMLLKSIIEKIVISNGNIEIKLKDF